MVRGPRTRGAARLRPVRKFRAKLVAIPVAHAGEARPESVRRMRGERCEKAELAREHRRASARIDEPFRADGPRFLADFDFQNVRVRAAGFTQLKFHKLRRTPQ